MIEIMNDTKAMTTNGNRARERDTRTDVHARARGRCLDKPWHKTFVRAGKHMSERQKRNMNEYWHTYGIEFHYGDEMYDFKNHERGEIREETTTRTRRPRALELGFGLGESMCASARARPDVDFFGCEVHKPGIATALGTIASYNLTNVRVANIDALWLLRDFIANESLDECCVYFPDPWNGENKAKRRLVNPLLIELLQRTLVRGGRLNITTDDDDYKRHITEVFAAYSATWRPSAEMFDRFDSKYARKAIEEGRTIRDFAFIYDPVRT